MAAADPTNPQSWNRYSYVMNNPANMTDPTGMDPFDEGGGFGGGGFGGGFGCAWCEGSDGGFGGGGGFGGAPTIPNWSGINLPGSGGNPVGVAINHCDFVECGLTNDDASSGYESGGDPGKGSDDSRSGLLCDPGYINASKQAWQQTMNSIGKKKEAGFWSSQTDNGYKFTPIPASSNNPDCRIENLTPPDNVLALTHDHPPGCGGVMSSPRDKSDQYYASHSPYDWYVISPQGQGQITDSGARMVDPGYTWMSPCKGSK